MPPSLILEVLRITELEMDLRDQTREAERVRHLSSTADRRADALKLSAEQKTIHGRTEAVIKAIRDLDNADDFRRELGLLTSASAAMVDAIGYLDGEGQGLMAVAAETEAIEHLLQSRRPSSGGGGGSDPGDGGPRRGQTDLSALALAGRSEDPRGAVAEREVLVQSGRGAAEPPVELRPSLDRYFERLNAR